MNPSRFRIRNETVVSSLPSSRASIDPFEPFLSEYSVLLTETHAAENGCDVHRPSAGMYRNTYCPGLNLHGRGIDTLTRATEPGRSSIVALVHLRPKLRQTRRHT